MSEIRASGSYFPRDGSVHDSLRASDKDGSIPGSIPDSINSHRSSSSRFLNHLELSLEDSSISQQLKSYDKIYNTKFQEKEIVCISLFSSILFPHYSHLYHLSLFLLLWLQSTALTQSLSMPLFLFIYPLPTFTLLHMAGWPYYGRWWIESIMCIGPPLIRRNCNVLTNCISVSMNYIIICILGLCLVKTVWSKQNKY